MTDTDGIGMLVDATVSDLDMSYFLLLATKTGATRVCVALENYACGS